MQVGVRGALNSVLASPCHLACRTASLPRSSSGQSLCDGVQMRCTWRQDCICIIIAAFSLRELSCVRFWFTRWSTPGCRWRGGSLPPVSGWEVDLFIAAWVLWLIAPPWLLGYGSIFTPPGFAYGNAAAGDDSCAARLDGLMATHMSYWA